MKSHNILGEGSKACWICHDSRNIGTLALLNGTKLSLADSSQLCGQCHAQRYEAWQKSTHGILGGKEELESLGGQKLKCISCHNPHQPKIDVAKLRTPSPLPVSGSGAPLDCLSCHARILEGHDKLGEGSKACWACHYNREMGGIHLGMLHLAGGETRFSLSDYPQLCAQCHQERYADWLEGTHGMPSGEVGAVEVHGVQRVGCISCHDPHQPQIALLNITKPHPEPVPAPPPPPTQLLIMLGISLSVIVGIGVILMRQGGRL
ncbi:MAG: hypothetical protein HY663_05820 [Chloroflexi bacterium]|nr:hypothetical protein [Chloroflexota bacterium]